MFYLLVNVRFLINAYKSVNFKREGYKKFCALRIKYYFLSYARKIGLLLPIYNKWAWLLN